MAMSTRTLNTIADIIEALGGIAAVADLTGRKVGAVYMWKPLGKFPANTFQVMKRALADRGYVAPDSLWGMAPAHEQEGLP